MATNAFNELMAEVNQTISDANKAASTANGAAATASTAATRANTSAEGADGAANAANAAAAAAGTETGKWSNATVEATTLAAGAAATMGITEKNGVKHLTFGIPRGNDGADGAKGDTGSSGLTVRLVGTSLYIDTN